MYDRVVVDRIIEDRINVVVAEVGGRRVVLRYCCAACCGMGWLEVTRREDGRYIVEPRDCHCHQGSGGVCVE